LKEIGGWAFYDSGLKSIQIPDKVEKIGDKCFSCWSSLCEVIFGSNSQLKEIGNSAFSDSGHKSIQIPDKVEKIGYCCFLNCKSLAEVILLGSPSIEIDAFADCSLKCIKVVKGVILKCKLPVGCVVEEIDDRNVIEKNLNETNEIGPSQEETKLSKSDISVVDEAVTHPGKEIRKVEVSEWVIDLKQDYESLGSIGENRRVELWKHRETGEEDAVKSYPRSHKSVEEVQTEFIREIEALIHLNHPCIVSIKGYCLPTKEEEAKLITEYHGIGSLKRLLSQTKQKEWWTIRRRTNCIVGLVVGMKDVHSKGFIHRDLKPDNILIDNELHIRICDFGSSRTFEFGVTMTNAGTPLYMAPEVDEGHYDCKVDVYSFGLILYEIVSCDGLFSSPGNKTGLLMKLRTGWRPELGVGIPSLSKNLIERCWSVDASCRPSFEELWHEMCANRFELIAGSDEADVESYLSYLERHGAVIRKG
jgi:serine/threonine protein kinase